jgi:hypothetical protein
MIFGEIIVKHNKGQSHWCYLFRHEDIEMWKTFKPWTTIDGNIVEYIIMDYRN